MNKKQIYDFIIDNNIATEKEINLVTCINGYNKKSLNNIIYARTGYHDPEQCLDCEPESFIFEESLLNKILK
tara:strand:- start:226 stop:441 length:216 start_codon:yes stop_codon:yes gene_type:complete